ncbi:hypothetical protein CRI78_23430 [Mycolicibacterium diernhoferi]|uniref:Uncharacterized protein n=1 Tax=Mycolicibacterium diernhoferi TaxID=1801 RepID=A0A1T3WMM0_9MYCO|nr:hypothetical protein BV510_04460 [Mycolicibacterium diernhoferi]PEG52093.1 hypothetical protein CRI78_23430 [Mycolicibacterium diernhoferi]
MKYDSTTRLSAVRKNTPPRSRRPKRNWARCGKSGKRRYRDWNDAKLALKDARFVRAIAEADGGACRWDITRQYLCGFCEGWHVTSQP